MKKRIVSMMLALLMAFGTFGFSCLIPTTVSAAESTATQGDEVFVEDEKYVSIVDAALNTAYESAQDKIDSDENMRPAAKYGAYELYVNDYTGEIAFKDTATGQILLSNPYNVPNYNSITPAIRAQLLSQIEIGYTDIEANSTKPAFYSYTEAAARGQIKVSNSKNGILVEYTMGREDSNYLVPGRITEIRMQEQIYANIFPYTIEIDLDGDGTKETYFETIEDFTEEILFAEGIRELLKATITDEFEQARVLQAFDDLRKLASFYELITYDQLKTNPTYEKDYGKYVKEDVSIYVRKKEVSVAKELNRLEGKIKEYCPNYTFDEMLKDHAETGYEEEAANPPLFKLALQYTLTDDGLTVRLPANGIRFDHSVYQLDYVTLLPFFGAGDLNDDGYLFYPDGSGAILYYEDLAKKSGVTLTGKVYGTDYAYHVISGKHQESIRMPVFGLVNEKTTTETDAEGNTTTSTSTTGFVAILEEGDAMANITASCKPALHNYASVYTTFYPRPKDTYDLSGTVTSGSNTSWTVEASRKYTGSYEMHIYMLSDESAKPTLEAAERDYFEASYVGMANAYRQYLMTQVNVLTPLAETDVTDGSIPLYIEAFGTVPDIKRILSIPVDVDVPLTTFADVEKMYQEISTNGISNVQFKLTGFANGGMYSTYPAKLKWMSEVGGKSGFNSLLENAKREGYGVYPEFDFMYINEEGLFDGVSLKAGAARTIDNRYSNKRVFNATYQEFVTYHDICVTPVMVEEYYARFAKKFSKYDPLGISVSTLGSDLNSDFGKKNPTNREEAKEIISGVLEQMSKDYGGKIMSSGGNAYALKYVEHLLDAAVDSSRFVDVSRSVPFVGMVLHGSVNFAGGALNMAGNTDYQILKAIENGASLYFMLSYDNTNLLKKYEDLSQYYSVNYKIWAGTYDEDGNLTEPGKLFETYNTVNNAIGHLQTSLIVDHQFLIGERVPDDLYAEDKAAFEAAMELAQEKADTAAKKEQIKAYRELYLKGEIGPGEVIDAVATDEAIQQVFESLGFAAYETKSDSRSDIEDYEATKYTLNDGMIVLVTYEDGTSFVLNYNNFAVKVCFEGYNNGEPFVVESYDFATLKL